MLSHTGFPLPNDYGLEDICCVLNRIVELQSDHLHGCDDPSSIPRELLAEHERYVFVLGHFDEQLFVVFLQRACKLQHILVLQPILQRVQYEIDVAIGFEDDELLIHRQLRDRGPIRICKQFTDQELPLLQVHLVIESEVVPCDGPVVDTTDVWAYLRHILRRFDVIDELSSVRSPMPRLVSDRVEDYGS
jgi:hypothetical protein